ncbi:MAG: ribonuclease E/G, partial [Brevundimonas diminuta]|nr:ribonuclease E/G [Brevundimonas diminuta]
MREEGERDVYAWVRGRTPSLQDPYVWFDPINPVSPRPERKDERRSEAAGEDTAQDVSLDQVSASEEGRNGRSRRRRGRGRGRGQGELTHETKVEDRAANEGLPPVGSPDTPIAVVIEGEATEEPAAEAAPAVEQAEAPKRRRVRRKVSAAAVEEATAAAPVEAEVEAAPVEADQPVPAELDVPPAVAARVEQAIEEALEEALGEIPAVAESVVEEAVVLADPVPAPTAEVDIAAIIADDPNQIGAPPAKPKRGWWRR